MKLRQYQIIPVANVIRNLGLGKKVILNGCPGSGKTEMAIYIIKKYLDEGKRVLVLAHSTNVLKKNFQDRWNSYYDNSPNLTICIPQSYKGGSYDLVVIDEAHENYLAKVVQDIVSKVATQLLLTGTPSKLIYKGQQNGHPFDIEVIAMENVPREFFSKTGIELLSTCYKWTETDYNKNGELKSKTSITKSDTESSLDAIILKLIDRLRNKSISPEKFNKPGILTRLQKAIFRNSNLGKTMFVCSRKSQADYVNNYLVKKGYSSKVSHSDSDGDSLLFDSFKKGEFDVLVVVNRGRLGFSDDNLMNIIDMSGTKNPDLIYQMFARCVRGNQSQIKLFMKLAPTGDAMHDLTSVSVQMALSLMFNDVISLFNGKNMKGMFIPVFKSNSESKKVKSNKADKVELEKKNRVIFPQYLTDVLVELKNIRYSLDDELSIYKKGEIGEIIQQISGGQLPSGWWTKERCLKESEKYKNSQELNVNNRVVYQLMRDNMWIHEAYLDFEYKDPTEDWTLEKTIEVLELKEFSKIGEFSKKYVTAYKHFVKDNQEIKNKYFPNRRVMVNASIKGNIYWTKEKCIEVAKLCSSRYDFEKKYKTAKLKMASQWPDLFNKIFPNSVRKTSWTKERIIEVAKDCSHREDMRKKHLQAYAVMTKSYPDLAEKIFGKKIMGKNRNNRLGLK